MTTTTNHGDHKVKTITRSQRNGGFLLRGVNTVGTFANDIHPRYGLDRYDFSDARVEGDSDGLRRLMAQYGVTATN